MNDEVRSPISDFRIQDMGLIYEASKGEPDHLHRHNYYTILVITDAVGIHVIDHESYRFGTSEIHFISPGQIHQVRLNKQPVGRALTFSSDFLAKNNIPESFISNINLFQDFGKSPPLSISPNLFSKLNALLNEMEACSLAEITYRERALGALLQLFLIYTNQEANFDLKILEKDGSAACILRDFKQLINQNFREEHQVSDYAKRMNISRKHLNNQIKKVTGKGAKEHIVERLILEIKRLLLHSDLSIKEISYQLSFKEPVHMSNFFKKYSGYTPTSFRFDHSI